jgi:16S rRNA (guanine966-N2)-methyltransferase
MRIISGKFKGRRLVSFQADHIRPTTDRVKETLFNKLTGVIEGARVLDLFSGTGNLAIECISRGAAWVDLVESHKKSLTIIRENLTTLKIEDGYKIFPIDAFSYIKKFEGTPYDLVIADPPFTRAWGHDLALAIGGSSLLAPEGLFVMEVASKERFDEVYPGLKRLDLREFGDKHLVFFQRENEDHDQGDLPR